MKMAAKSALLVIAILFFAIVSVQTRRDREETGIYSAGWKDGEWHNPDNCYHLSTHNKGSCEEVCRRRGFKGGYCGGPFWSQCWCTN